MMMRSPTASRDRFKSQMKLPRLRYCPNLSHSMMYRYVLGLPLIVEAVPDLRVYSGLGRRCARYSKEEEEESVDPVATFLTQT